MTDEPKLLTGEPLGSEPATGPAPRSGELIVPDAAREAGEPSAQPGEPRPSIASPGSAGARSTPGGSAESIETSPALGASSPPPSAPAAEPSRSSTTIPPPLGGSSAPGSASRYGPGAGSTRPATEAPEPDLWDRCAAWVMDHGALHGLALITLAMILIYAHIFAGEVAGDDLTFHMAESVRIADCLRIGDFDLWNPSGNAGFASAYYYQVVPQLISAIPAAVFGHHVFFFQLSVFLPLVLAPAAAYRGMRLLGATPWQATIAALAVGFTNGDSRWGTGNAGTFQVGLYTQTWALAAFPLALGHAARWATEGRGLAPAIAWGAFVALCHPFAGAALGIALLAGWVAQVLLGAIDLGLREIGNAVSVNPHRNLATAAVAAIAERWRTPPPRPWAGELVRLAVYAVGLALASLPFLLPLLIDYAGFGGFPHRVNDEVGPGFLLLGSWYVHGAILDYQRAVVLTWALPVVALLARARYLRWLWAPAVAYAAWLGLGPHLPKTDDDLLPAVRLLGAMQVAVSLAIGAGFLALCRRIWDAPEGSPLSRGGRLLIVAGGVVLAGVLGYLIWSRPANATVFLVGQRLTLDALSPEHVRWLLLGWLAVVLVVVTWLMWRALQTQFGVRTGLAAGAAVLGVLLTIQGATALGNRVHVLPDYAGSHGDELHAIARMLQAQPPGRKQVGAGAESHWWNLLSYEYGRRPSLLMMGGGGLQASPNYDFLWNHAKDYLRDAWVYDAPLLVLQKSSANAVAGAEPVFETKNYAVRRMPAPGLVSPVEVTGALPSGDKKAIHAAALDWYKTDQPLQDRVLEYPSAASSGGLRGPPHGTVAHAARQDSPGDAADIVAVVDATARTTFMARESWHPRWHAYIDGAPATVRRVTPNFPAVDVPAGHHVVAFRFQRPWWAQLAWLAWPLVPLLAWWLTRDRARRPSSWLAPRYLGDAGAGGAAPGDEASSGAGGVGGGSVRGGSDDRGAG